MSDQKDKFRETDDEARALACRLLSEARYGALGVLVDDAPFVTRVALQPGDGHLVTLVSDLAPHTDALRESPDASLMIGNPGRGDPLAHPRMTLQVSARFIEKTPEAARTYLATQPKAQLYIGFADFHLVRLDPAEIWLNGGFGKAYRLAPGDLRPG
ncbi:MAG: pyridoxamine 5-phosphate oxidase [Silicimonas sp.]|nr:pyridoxamine 5-phosphate oxidase [Silicimonas sp.]